MSEDELAVVCETVLAYRRARREIFSDLDRAETVLALALAERGKRSYAFKDVRFRLVPRTIAGSPSQRRKWRENVPAHAFDAFHQPLRVVIDYPSHESKIA